MGSKSPQVGGGLEFWTGVSPGLVQQSGHHASLGSSLNSLAPRSVLLGVAEVDIHQSATPPERHSGHRLDIVSVHVLPMAPHFAPCRPHGRRQLHSRPHSIPDRSPGVLNPAAPQLSTQVVHHVVRHHGHGKGARPAAPIGLVVQRLRPRLPPRRLSNSEASRPVEAYDTDGLSETAHEAA